MMTRLHFAELSAEFHTGDDYQIVEFGANLFFGRDDFTFFGQFENASNLYGSIRFQL